MPTIKTAYDLLMAENDVLAAYENLTEAEKQFADADTVVTNVISALRDLRTIENLDEFIGIVNADGGLEALVGSNVVTDKVALENKFTDAVSEGFKKFWEKICQVASYIRELVEKLFKTLNYKIKTIIENAAQKLDFDKKTNIISKENYLKCGAAIKDLTDFCDKYIKLPNSADPMLRGPENTGEILERIRVAHNDVFVPADKSKIVVGGPATELVEQTISEAKYAINDIIKMCGSYATRTKKFSTISDMFHRMKDSVIRDVMISGNAEYASLIREVVAADMSGYSAMAKLHSLTAKNIAGFYRCLTADAVKFQQPEGEKHVSISYTP